MIIPVNQLMEASVQRNVDWKRSILARGPWPVSNWEVIFRTTYKENEW